MSFQLFYDTSPLLILRRGMIDFSYLFLLSINYTCEIILKKSSNHDLDHLTFFINITHACKFLLKKIQIIRKS